MLENPVSEVKCGDELTIRGNKRSCMSTKGWWLHIEEMKCADLMWQLCGAQDLRDHSTLCPPVTKDFSLWGYEQDCGDDWWIPSERD
jgi:hypothetical protein